MGKDIDTKIDELAAMMARGFTELREEIAEFRLEVNNEFSQVRAEIATKADKADLEQFVGTVRKDYDSLAIRVKDIEDAAV